MQLKGSILLIVILLIIQPSVSITKYDFNVCRIKFCADKQAACISDEDACMDAFSKTRACFEGCKSADQLETYNKCWASCKQASAYANNGLYNSLGICYENICYVNEMFLIKIIGFMILTFLLLA